MEAGITLVELLTTLAIFFLVMAGAIGSHLYGLRMSQIVRPKLGASDQSRQLISKLVGEIRSAKLVRVGNGDENGFSEASVDSPQAGCALQVYPTLSTNTWVRYYLNLQASKLMRVTSDGTAPTLVANAVSNSVVFTSEDFSGRLLTNNFNNRVIGLRLEFYQIQYPITSVGQGNYYDYYQLRTRITRRSIL
jgi:hypothetical protein